MVMNGTTEKKDRLSRREFLKTTAVAGAAAGGALALHASPAEAIPVPKKWDKTADVVIVGSGYSGLAAAIVSRQLGMSVVVLEKMPVVGGNSVIAHGGANAVDPVRQKRQGIEDSTDLHFKHTMEGGDNINDPDKVRYFVEHALEDAVNYLERLGSSGRKRWSEATAHFGKEPIIQAPTRMPRAVLGRWGRPISTPRWTKWIGSGSRFF
jgi:hypothetical protein